jgi:hypothetical protein
VGPWSKLSKEEKASSGEENINSKQEALGLAGLQKSPINTSTRKIALPLYITLTVLLVIGAIYFATKPNELDCSKYIPFDNVTRTFHCDERAREKYYEERIFDNCVVSKMAEITDNNLIETVRRICHKISINPSLLDRMRY